MNKYWKQYINWGYISQMRAMRRNKKAEIKECDDDFKERLVVITGATSGIGYCTARKYALHRANLLLINRNEEKSISVCEEIRQDFDVECEYKIADFTRISDVQKLGYELLDSDIRIDVLIHNAGVYSTKKVFTEDNFELCFQVDYLGSFILNYILKDKLKAQDNTRIIFVNSEGHRFAILGLRLDELEWEKHHYSGLRSYGKAKTAQLLSMISFDDYFKDSGVSINAMHPGSVKTNMGQNNGPIYRFFKRLFIDRAAKSPEISAKALYYLGVSKEINGVSGKFFRLTSEEKPAPPALDREVAKELWSLSIKLGGLE
ncbi:MAG: SDR family NAD(P)-dependent oxidoreductase [Candidatus Lokiarchaeota archaeon]|nr:SDR family NAD(P)-dependent oxidoreductase [Candidatus Lokiarchaeota archaeon]